ncbi:MAG: 50S ribosomal protein L4 [Pseudodesulfovibrio sp.]|uniref:Large ribosomal subunit protein uL4 n=1 Tax=Pseudodesulfovibrio aespoeensis (strain ATCC 700646 / DSM 10631 / Aspo-2) TaxID=643562 RepID=E6VTA0_PSEA9|nr:MULTISPECIES: 50S ribosomal protein L4 [Pseudodesulfovibrio]MBU4244999.1 50S ribosomal protein L4 [Pseudomonadota bacterium]ADU63259.1 ribosomal protein L4/L1e [Pseudodesulfovibrio aespoeensis Aspo-2]MBU4379007.1 50S ribosomal protein L4 [Pseudomonadota bacterium]MBU4475156.1 50S ribosomal protein L4 [Pseudomonadota bacterium]MBU4516170.1 50S ribosomal protein L4 [Pseudomonadota bacterium]
MAKLQVVDQNNQKVGDIELAPEVFEVEIQPEILNLVVRAQRAAKRSGTHATKTRGMKSGGGRKPWRQKGTGRARAGSSRSPLWRGGAVLFGPQPRDYSFKVNKKIRKLALQMALSSRVAEDKVTVVKSIDLAEIKTKAFAAVVEKLGLGKTLIVLKDADLNLALSARNVPGIKVIEADKLNVYDVLLYPELVMFEAAAQDVQERLK